MAFNARAKPIFGIISGAGPMAGISLLKQTIQLFQNNGSWKDSDFPEIHLINFPFSEMLEHDFDQEKVRAELKQCMQNLQANCDYIVIACNTLHLFLPQEKSAKLISLIDLIKSKIPTGTKPIILASYTSAAQNLHGRLLKMECEYWQPANSQSFINEILQGKKPELDWIVDLAKTRMLILGCTEYSLALEELPPSENVIDPIKLAAQTFFELSRCKPSSQGSTKLCEH